MTLTISSDLNHVRFSPTSSQTTREQIEEALAASLVFPYVMCSYELIEENLLFILGEFDDDVGIKPIIDREEQWAGKATIYTHLSEGEVHSIIEDLFNINGFTTPEELQDSYTINVAAHTDLCQRSDFPKDQKTAYPVNIELGAMLFRRQHTDEFNRNIMTFTLYGYDPGQIDKKVPITLPLNSEERVRAPISLKAPPIPETFLLQEGSPITDQFVEAGAGAFKHVNQADWGKVWGDFSDTADAIGGSLSAVSDSLYSWKSYLWQSVAGEHNTPEDENFYNVDKDGNISTDEEYESCSSESEDEDYKDAE